MTCPRLQQRLVNEPTVGEGLPLKFEFFIKRDDGLQVLYSVGNFSFRPRDPSKCYRSIQPSLENHKWHVVM
uniref:Uncharacterized protein n=1 Tax=Aegilops tauschii TaxID=37682 RepID=M8BQR1_AEGTA